MADRRVSVVLELIARQFKDEAKSTARDVEHLSDKVEELDHDITKIPPDAAKAAAAFGLLGASADEAAGRVKNLGQKDVGLSVLDAKIKETRGEVRKLADEFQKTGDVDVFKKLGDAQGRLEGLTRVRKDLAAAVEGGVADGLGKIGNAGSGEFPGLGQLAMQAGAAMAVPLGAAIGGAITAGVGAGVAGLGVAGAVLGDPERFQLAWGSALTGLKAQFIDATKPFTGPTLAAIAGIGPLIASWHIDTVFANAAKFVGPLVHGTESLATGLVNGIGALVDKGGPAINALSQGMVQLGQAGESALKSIADGAEGGAQALHDTITAVSLLIEGTGKLVGGFENVYGYVHNHPIESALLSGGLSVPITGFEAATSNYVHQLGEIQKAADATSVSMQVAAHSIDLAGGQAMSASDQYGQLISQLKAVNNTADTVAAAMVHKLFTATMNLDQANLSVAESLTKVTDTLKTNHHELDIHSAKGQADREVILGAVTANMQLYQAQIAAGMKAEDAAKAYDDNTAALERQLRKAGLTTAQIDDLIGKYKGIPAKVDADIAIRGLTDAITDLDTLLRQINGLHDKTIKIQEITYTYTAPNQTWHGFAHGGIRRAAVGMLIPPSDPGTTLVGEPQTGGEALIPLRGISQSRAMGLANVVGSAYGFSVGAGGGGMQTLRVVLQYPDGRVVVDKVVEWNANRGRSDPATFFMP